MKKPMTKHLCPTQLEIENRLLADAMRCLRSDKGRRVQLSSLRPGDRLSGLRVGYVFQNSRTLQKLEVCWRGGRLEVFNYAQAALEFDSVQSVACQPLWRRFLYSWGILT